MTRVASFVPTATEWMYALGLDDQLVSVTFECDVPPRAAREKPLAVRSTLEAAPVDTAGIHRAVVERTGPLYRLDEAVLREARPDAILTQSLCDVCAASHAQVADAKRILGYAPRLLEVSPARLDDIPEDARAIARFAGAPGRGDALAADLARRIAAVRAATAGRARPRVVALEWTDPPMSAGHWIPDILDAAGLHDPLGEPGGKSRVVTWEDVRAVGPHALLVLPCGLDLDRSRREAERIKREFPRTEVIAFDANRYFARGGPSVATAIGMLAHLFHPAVWPVDPDPAGWVRVR